MIDNPIPWPDGAKCAASFTFDMDAESLAHLGYPDTADSRVATLSELRYGPKIAIPRILEVFRRHRLRQTFYIPGWCVETYPDTIELILKDGHEIGHHGYLHEMPNRLSAEDERYWFERALQSLKLAMGRSPTGYRAPSYAFSKHTLGLLLEHGFDYDASLMGDDQPYLLEHARGSMVELPSCRALDDWSYFVLNRDFNWLLPVAAPEAALASFRAEFDALWRRGGLWIAVWHPFVMGRPARMDMMEELLLHMQRKGGVWFAAMDEISAHVRKVMREGQWAPRVERMPYVVSPIPELKRT
jgi:peptidoglycan/xylan/chitin deacetylase (PgdA/CDA1 family)